MAKSVELARALRLARVTARLSQLEAAERLDVSRATIVNWESETGGTTPSREDVLRAAAVYGADPRDLVSDAPAGAGARGATGARAAAGAPGRRRLSPKVYAELHGYLEKLTAAGIGDEELTEAEKLLSDWSFSKLFSRDGREPSEDDMLLQMQVAWSAIEETLRDQGVKL